MRRIRVYQNATRRRKVNQMFQGKMLVHLVQSKKAKSRRKIKEITR